MEVRVSALALGMLLLGLTLGATPAQAAPEDFIAACSNGIVVPDPEDNPGLVRDCAVLLSIRDTLAGDATLDWNVDQPVETWEGVAVASEARRVVGLSLYASGLTGEIPSQIGSLSQLRQLSLGENRLVGTIPPTIGSLEYLEGLSLSGNMLAGEIPPELGSLSLLRSLVLRENILTGLIPEELGSLNRLTGLSLRYNRLSGPIPRSFKNLSSIVVMELQGNELSGEIPKEIGNLDKLSQLYLSSNKIGGEIPPSIGDLKSLVVLRINSNRLVGVIPSEISRLSRLEQFNTSHNMLTGSIPPEIANLRHLNTVLLNDNRLTGEIPSGLGNLLNLKNLTLGGNEFSGCVLPRLRSVENNDLDRISLPNCSAFAPADIEACSNGIAVPDPEGNPGLVQDCAILLGARDALAAEQITTWKATEPISSWEGVTVRGRVAQLSLSGRDFGGAIPWELVGLQKLDSLDLVGLLYGPMPPVLAEMGQLRALLLCGNLLTGSIPADLARLARLESLWLCDNRLTGAIPRELGTMHSLRQLLLSENDLMGSIPPELADLPRLSTLWLSHNRLTGQIPPELVLLPNLEQLLLGSNLLSGCIPPELYDVGFHDLDEVSLPDCLAPDHATMVDLRVWQGAAAPTELFYSARVRGDSWATIGTHPLPMTGLSGSGLYRYGDLVVKVPLAAFDLHVRIWQRLSDPWSLYLSARPVAGSWSAFGTVPLDMQVTGSGRHLHGDVTLEVGDEGVAQSVR